MTTTIAWRLVSSQTRPGSMLRIVRWAARMPNEAGYVYRECVYELPAGQLLADEEEAARVLMQTRYGTTPDGCTHEQLEQLLQPTALPC